MGNSAVQEDRIAKTLSKVFLAKSIQDGLNWDSALQDAVAAKDAVDFCLEKHEYLKKWAEVMRHLMGHSR